MEENMVEQKKRNYVPVIAAVLFVAVAIGSYFLLVHNCSPRVFGRNIRFVQAFPHYLGLCFSTVLLSVGALLSTYSLLSKNKYRKYLLFSGIALVTVALIVENILVLLLAFERFYRRRQFFKTPHVLTIVFSLLNLAFVGVLIFGRHYDSLKLPEKARTMIKKFLPVVNKFWFIPSAVIAFAGILRIFFYAVNFRHIANFRLYCPLIFYGFFLCIFAVTMFFTTAYLVFGDKAQERLFTRQKKIPNACKQTCYAHEKVYYLSLPKFILFVIITLGIYAFVWVYKMTKHTNDVEGESYRNPTKKLLLCIFVPLYEIYWNYKTALRLNKMAVAAKLPGSGAFVMLATVSPIGNILLQDKMNEIAIAESQAK